ncbi:hypothetical protein [Actinokineospora diospyrosa]|uniref:ESAT-6 protein secretion system EspG family protein n=1 Tax=Actinokineospora diospyrosa TaxID=103728 RepID=A0ABT1IGZ5_9PSEU|nr:hypothetical protein [Actinokineospora diospyrosa]MCP2271913.1 hypothetical protein [Actinokineospora diospyrosa]
MNTLETLRPGRVARPQLRRVLPDDLSAALLADVPAYHGTDTADLLCAALVVAVGDRGTVRTAASTGGLARTVRRLTAATDLAVIGFHYPTDGTEPEVSGAVDVVVRVVAGQIASTWSWRADARTERAVVDLAGTWCDALARLAAGARSVSPIPSAMDKEPASVAVDLPGAISPNAVRKAIDAVACRYPYLATGRRVVGGSVFAVRGAGTSLRCTRSDPFHPDWTPVVQFELVRTGAARTRLTIAANPLLVGDLTGLAREVRAELAGDPDHVSAGGMDSAATGN